VCQDGSWLLDARIWHHEMVVNVGSIKGDLLIVVCAKSGAALPSLPAQVELKLCKHFMVRPSITVKRSMNYIPCDSDGHVGLRTKRRKQAAT
jgi:hypothetical protein